MKISFWLKLLPFLAAAALYTWTVQLPFFSDDVLHFRYATQVATLDIWTKPDITGIYYRPVVNFILHVALTYLGVPLSAPIWHALIVWNHLLNIALVGALARTLRMNTFAQVVAMLIFALFPFNAQAVVWVLAWFHPLAATAVLGFCVAGLGYLNRQEKHAKKKVDELSNNVRRKTLGILVAAWLIGGIAPFIHENGVLSVPLLGWLVLCRFGVRGTLARWKSVLLVTVPPLLFALLYFWLRRVLFPPTTGGAPLGASLIENLAVFAQGLSFPLQFFTTSLPFDGVTQAWIGFAVFIVVCLILFFSVNQWFKIFPTLLAGAGWWALAALPAALALTPIYVQLSERLLYVAAPGIALVYAALLSNNRGKKFAVPLRILQISALLVIMALSLWFILPQNRLYTALGNAYREMSVLLREGGDVPTLLVNMPQQIDNVSYTLPLTREHAFVLHDYLALRDFVWLNTDREFTQLGAAISPNILDTWEGYAPHFYASGDLSVAQSERVILFSLVNEQYTARLVGERTPASENMLADFDGVRLENVTFARAGEHLRVGLQWRRLADAPIPYVVFVHLLCGETIIDQSDGAPIGNLYDFELWQVDETWRDYRYLDVTDAADECLALRIGLYRRDDGTRAPVTDASGDAIGEALVVPVTP